MIINMTRRLIIKNLLNSFQVCFTLYSGLMEKYCILILQDCNRSSRLPYVPCTTESLWEHFFSIDNYVIHWYVVLLLEFIVSTGTQPLLNVAVFVCVQFEATGFSTIETTIIINSFLLLKTHLPSSWMQTVKFGIITYIISTLYTSSMYTLYTYYTTYYNSNSNWVYYSFERVIKYYS